MSIAIPPAREGAIYSPDSRGWHRVVYSDWGPENGPLVLCLHYLTGNGRYFDTLAKELARQGYRVVAPDMPGRGRSDDLKNPDDYTLRQYIVDITGLLGALGVRAAKSFDCIGASMGGYLGMLMAAMAETPVHKLALIDVGPAVAAPALEQIAAYVGAPPAFPTMTALEDFIRQSRALAWGPVPDGYWQEFTQANARARADGTVTLGYDPGIGRAFAREAPAGLDLWAVWDLIACPVLTLRGENSTLLTADVAAEMTTRGPGKHGTLQLNVIAGCGHVPSLAMPEQISLIGNWLKG